MLNQQATFDSILKVLRTQSPDREHPQLRGYRGCPRLPCRARSVKMLGDSMIRFPSLLENRHRDISNSLQRGGSPTCGASWSRLQQCSVASHGSE